jgi:hypothetical protein
LSKLVRLGELPVKLEVAAYYNALRPIAGQDPWQFQATVNFILAPQPAAPVSKQRP